MDTIKKLDGIFPEKITATELEKLYQKGDFLIIDGLKFEMSFYSACCISGSTQISRYVSYSGNGVTIDLDRETDTIEIY